MTHTGTTAFLRQAHRNNWEQYLAALRPGAAPGWDICVLTASDERQAEMYRCQLNWRREAGLLPASMHFLVLPDPGGRRIGSGGATLNALLQVAGLVAENEGGRLDALQRVLLIHSGGDSKRLPPCSATGKLFARVPRVLPDGRASSIFDEFLIGLSGLATQLPPGVLIASGDVLLIFDNLQLSFRRPGVIGVAAATPAEMGLDHGVYVSGDGSHRVRAYLHKPSLEELNRWGGIGADGTVQIDTGLVWLDAISAQKLVMLARDETVGRAPLNLYGDLLLPLADSTTLESYLADESDGPATPAAVAARSVLWERMRGTPFTVERLQPAVFVHFGTSCEYWQMAAGDPELADLCGWTPSAASWDAAVGCGPAGPAVLIDAAVEAPISPHLPVQGKVQRDHRPLIVDSHLRGAISWAVPHTPGAAAHQNVMARNAVNAEAIPSIGEDCFGPDHGPAYDLSLRGGPQPDEAIRIRAAEIASGYRLRNDRSEVVFGSGAAIISGVQTGETLRVGPDVVIDQMPVIGGCFVTRVFGLHDDPKLAWNAAGATFMNLPWTEWLAVAGITPEWLWPHVTAGAQSLWNARLYPVLPDRDESLRTTLALQDPAATPDGWRAAWQAAPRLSLAESAAQADGPRLLAELAALEDTIATRRFCAAVVAEQPALEARTLLGNVPAAVARRSRLAAESVASGDPILQLRGFKALAEATGEHAWEDRAFSALAEMIESATLQPPDQRSTMDRRPSSIAQGGFALAHRPVQVRAAARIDLGGGWTDTPPHSIERGGTVLNAALTLRGAYPIEAEAVWLPEPRLILISQDQDTTLEPTHVGEVLAYARPGDPFSLHKAALVLRGLVPAKADPAVPLTELLRDRGGLRLSTSTNIPFGSGLGTSSILAGAVLAALAALDAEPSGVGPHPSSLFDEVLCLEQMLTTGGGWQDQVGGLTGGIKLVTTPPGLPQRITVTPVQLSTATAAQLGERLLLVYTSQRRLAKNLLRTVMARWMARDPEMTWIQGEIARLAVAMRDALLASDLDELGSLLAAHWTLNKRMDPGCTNPFIDELFETMGPYICGGKLAGAGGGGFVIAIARSAETARALAAALAQRYPGTPVEIWESAVPEIGLQVHIDP
jgi:galactokinase/mevalonate kinase-like predicted kinase